MSPQINWSSVFLVIRAKMDTRREKYFTEDREPGVRPALDPIAIFDK